LRCGFPHDGTSRVTIDIGVAMLAGCFIAYWAFEKLREPQRTNP
jgi:hypothetical protein